MKKVSIFLAEGFEEVEALTVVDLLRRAEISVTMVSITGEQYVTGAHDIVVKSDKLFDEVSYEEMDMLILPGGMPGTLNLKKDLALCKLLKVFNSEGKDIAAICAAPTVLGSLNILVGKDATAYPGKEEELVGAVVKSDNVVMDANIVTSRGLGTAIEFSLRLIERLEDKQTAEKIEKAILASL